MDQHVIDYYWIAFNESLANDSDDWVMLCAKYEELTDTTIIP